MRDVCNGINGDIQTLCCAGMSGRWEQAAGDAGISRGLVEMGYRGRGKGLGVKECGEADAGARCFRRNVERTGTRGVHAVAPLRG